MLLTATDLDMKNAIVLAVLILAGCGSHNPPSAQFDDANCKAYGGQPGTPEYSACRQSYENARRQELADAQGGHMIAQEAARALKAYSDGRYGSAAGK